MSDGPLGRFVAETVPGQMEVEWYGDPDHRFHQVIFDKYQMRRLKAKHTAEDGVREIVDALNSGRIDKTSETIPLDSCITLARFHETLNEVVIDGAYARAGGDGDVKAIVLARGSGTRLFSIMRRVSSQFLRIFDNR